MGKRSQLRKMQKAQESRSRKLNDYNRALFISWQNLPWWEHKKLACRLLFRTDMRKLKVVEKKEKRAVEKAIILKKKMEKRIDRNFKKGSKQKNIAATPKAV